MDSASIEFDGTTVADLIDAFGGAAAFSRVIGKKPSTASEMKRRGSIPVEYWPAIVCGAAKQGIVGIDNNRLVGLHTAQIDAPGSRLGSDGQPAEAAA